MAEITINGKELSVTDEQIKQINEILEIGEFCFKQKSVNSIAGKFLIKDYQRGYRWTKIEVEDLLNDINGIENNEEYCLQPLIVRKIDKTGDEKYFQKLGLEDASEKEIGDGFKKFGNDSTIYELIDGQQRLTTIWLILHHKQLHHKQKESLYDIYYSNSRPIDNAFIKQARQTINEWINSNLKEENAKNAFLSKLTEKAYFIWYEFKGTNNGNKVFSAEEEFRNVNAGKIPLTNAELFKAMLLNDEIIKQSSGNIDFNKRDIYKMAFDWDNLEQKLSEPNFWNFISGKECDDSAHLDYLFELEAYQIRNKYFANIGRKTRRKTKSNKLVPVKNFIDSLDKFSFLTVRKYLEYRACEDGGDKKISIRFSDIREEWENIKNLYNTLYKYFSDSELYNYLGFLVACDEDKSRYKMVPDCIKRLFEQNVENLQDVKNYVKNEIFTLLKNSVDKNKSSLLLDDDMPNPDYYDNANLKDIRNFLLFFNVWTTNKSNERFPFYKYRNSVDEKNDKLQWDIEHISARNLKKDITEELETHKEDRDDYIKSLMAWMSKEIEDEDQLKSDIDSNENEFTDLWKKFADYVDRHVDNSIVNLALLDRNTNRGYGNSLFLKKRNEIIERDKKGWYIPIATKNVFLKYYSSTGDTGGWGSKDKDAYREEIINCINDLKNFGGGKKNEQ